MAKIRHIAIFAKDTRGLAEFYKTTFGMEEVATQTPTEAEGGAGRLAIYRPATATFSVEVRRHLHR